jgi:hypothetical protein
LNPRYEEIVVGSSLRALLFAADRNIPVFFSTPEKPHRFDHFQPSVDLSSWGLNNEPQLWQMPRGKHKTGQNKIALWEHLLFVLGLKGLVPFSDFCSSLRLDTNELTGFSDYAKLRTVEFDRCYYFDEHATYNLLPCEKSPKTYHVYDDFAFIRGGKHHLDLMESKDQFCNKIWFETIVRLTMLEKMKGLGLRGPRNGYQKDGSIRYRSFKVEAFNREKLLTSPPLWLETDTIKVPKIKEEDLVKDLERIAEKHKRILGHLWQST